MIDRSYKRICCSGTGPPEEQWKSGIKEEWRWRSLPEGDRKRRAWRAEEAQKNLEYMNFDIIIYSGVLSLLFRGRGEWREGSLVDLYIMARYIFMLYYIWDKMQYKLS